MDEENKKASTIMETVALKRHMGFFSCVGMIIGIVVGSGIFVSPKGVLQGSGSVGLTLIIWFICGVIGLLGALAFCELGSLYPNSGGAYLYITEAFCPSNGDKKKYSWWRNMIPFLVSWQYNLAQKPATTAVQCMTISDYLLQLADKDCVHDFESYLGINPQKILAACFVILITFINCYSTEAASKIINMFSIFKLIGIGFIVIFGIKAFSSGTKEAVDTGFEGTTFTADGLALSIYSGLWAVSGWDNLVSVTKELINPKRNLLLSLVFSLSIIVTLYILINCAYFTVLTKEEFLASNAVAVDFARKVGGQPAAIFIVVAISMSVFGSVLGIAYTNVRLAYAAGLKGHLWDFISYLHFQKMTPVVALLSNGMIALLLLSQSSVLGLISLFGFIDGLVIALAMVSLLIIKRRQNYDADVLRFPVIIPVVVLGFYSFLTVMPFIDNPRVEYLYVLVMLAIGVVAFFIFFQNPRPNKYVEKLKIFGQKILLVAPPEGKEF